MHSDVDILIAGGGIAGLTAAAAFGHAGFEVLIVDPAPPPDTPDDPAADLRSTALLQPARTLLEEIDLWQSLAPHGTALQTMRLVDASGENGAIRSSQSFNASEISDTPFGWNFPNWLLRRELASRLADLPNITFRPGIAATGLVTRTQEARIALSDGTRVRARLVIAADGRASPMRAAAGITAQTARYGQKALVFAVSHPIPHQNTSTEIHRSGGPFTLVPLPDQNSRPRSAVVWMDHGPAIQKYLALDTTEFEAAITERSAHVAGPLRLISRRAAWPIITRHAAKLTAERLALMAEAAHVVPPIGAQGLNMSLTDLRTLLDLARAAPQDLGSAQMLETYETKRKPDIAARIAGIDALNRISLSGASPLTQLRSTGLDAIGQITPLRRTLMKMGLGLR